MSESGIKAQFRVHLVGRVTKDATLEMIQTQKGNRPLTKFDMMVSSGKNRKTQEWQTPWWFSVKVWGDRFKGIRKGDDIAVVGLMKRYEDVKDGKKRQFDSVEVVTDEAGNPSIVWAGDSQAQRGGLSDEQVAAGKGKSIQVKRNEESDETLPF